MVVNLRFLDEVRVNFTAEVYRLLMNQIYFIALGQPVPGGAVPIIEVGEVPEAEVEEHGAMAVPVESPAEPAQPFSHFSNQSMSITAKTLVFTLYNDLLSVTTPLMRLSAAPLDLNLHGFGHDQALRIAMTAKADFYNIRNVSWEPLVECWHTELKLDQAVFPAKYLEGAEEPDSPAVLQGTAGPCKGELLASYNLGLTVSDTIDVAVSAAMMSCVSTIQAIVPTLWAAPAEARSKDHPYVFENATEFPVQMVLLNPDGVAQEKHVSAYSSAPFTMKAPDPTEHRIELTIINHLNWEPTLLEIDRVCSLVRGFPWRPPSCHPGLLMQANRWVKDIIAKRCFDCSAKFNLVKRKHHCRGCGLVFCDDCSDHRFESKRYCDSCFQKLAAFHRNETIQVLLVLEVTVDKGIKHVRIHSPLGFKNETPRTLQMGIPWSPADSKSQTIGQQEQEQQEKAGTITAQRSVHSGETHWLPLLRSAYFKAFNAKAALQVVFRPWPEAADEQALALEYEWSKEVTLRHPSRGLNNCITAVCHPLDLTAAAKVKGVGGCPISSDYVFTVHHASDGDYDCHDASMSTLFSVRASISVQNLLATDVQVRLVEDRKSGKVVELLGGGLVKRGQSTAFSAPLFKRMSISVSAPALGCGWSKLELGESASQKPEPGKGKVALHRLLLTDAEGRDLIVRVEVSRLRGTVNIVLFVNYWFFDLSDLGLEFSEDRQHRAPRLKDAGERAKTGLVVQGGLGSVAAAEYEAVDARVAQMVSFSGDKAKVFVRGTYTDWCKAAFPCGIAGLDGAVSMPCDGRNIEVGITVEQGVSKYMRTKMVIFAPRVLIKNLLPQAIEIHENSQRADTEHCVRIDSQQEIVYHPQAADADIKTPSTRALSFKRVVPSSHLDFDYLRGFNWSGYFDLNLAGDVVLNVRDRVSHASFFARVSVRKQGPTVFVIIAELKPPPKAVSLRYAVPFAVENRSSIPLRYRQTNSHQLMTAVRNILFILAPPCSTNIHHNIRV
jgi:hypothetical protein